MVRDGVPNQFDELSRVYDSTRDPLDESTLDSIAGTLNAWGIRRLLEVGVGTGRVAVPLIERGLEVTGIDASSGMLARAREKRMDRLVRASAYRLPFSERAFDAGFFVHVLHLLDDPRRAIEESNRVGRLGTIALVEPRPVARPDAPAEPQVDPRRLVYDLLRRDGFSVPARARGPRVGEREILESLPPDRLIVLSEDDVTEPFSQELDFLAQGASRWTLGVPRDALRKAVAEARELLGDGSRTYRRVRALARWGRERGSA